MSTIKQNFNACVSYVQRADADLKPSNELKLELYALFKQATEGDVNGAKPKMTDFIARAKYCAWENDTGLSAEAAMQRYIERIETLQAAKS
ncbi:MAG: diazepam-binding inhibitor (GABA receptor modulating acyl-CoA-binding protein) [Motiliproteus sp.]|jgi:diazepam-binding inhibitor (GABA receptor modulating acyl-CoA-binding protein)